MSVANAPSPPRAAVELPRIGEINCPERSKHAPAVNPLPFFALFIGVTVSCFGVAKAAEADEAPLPESSEAVVEYPSVAAALVALRARPEVIFTIENGWIIATDEAAFTIWSFAPPSYPAYPAVVKRSVVSEGRGSSIRMDVHCEASKSACDNLMRTFSEMNGFELPQ